MDPRRLRVLKLDGNDRVIIEVTCSDIIHAPLVLLLRNIEKAHSLRLSVIWLVLILVLFGVTIVERSVEGVVTTEGRGRDFGVILDHQLQDLLLLHDCVGEELLVGEGGIGWETG